MVPLAGLVQPVEIGVELFLLEPGGAVDSLEHLALFIAPPVGAGRGEQLEVLEPTGAGDVGPAAQVGEGPVGVDGNGLVVAQFGDPLELKGSSANRRLASARSTTSRTKG